MQINFIINRIYKHRMDVEIAILSLWCLSRSFGVFSECTKISIGVAWINRDVAIFCDVHLCIIIASDRFTNAYSMQNLCTIYGNEASCNLT